MFVVFLQQFFWHPLKDSNLRMLESKSSALDQLGEGGIVWWDIHVIFGGG
jgi:hypothetical protein